MLAAHEIVTDEFAGGGGASVGIERALGRVDVAVNHDPVAIAVHTLNHPNTRHFCKDVWNVSPREACAGRRPGLAWFSPDCTHHSKAKGGKPLEKRIRGLAWVVLRWAADVRPRVIILENVEEWTLWGPLTRSRKPCKRRQRETFYRWVDQLVELGYDVEWQELRACDFGAPTSRNRVFLVARCDGNPIRWPEPTHGIEGSGLLPYRTAADIIDWSIPCPSIFLTKKQARKYGVRRPLADATMARVARGVQRYVIDAAEPFIKPLGTTVPRGGKPAKVAAFMAQHNTDVVGHAMTEPVSTIIGKGCTQALVSSHLVKLRGTSRIGQAITEPVPTITGGGTHLGEVRAFLLKYYGASRQTQGVDEPLHTIPAKARYGLVVIDGTPWQIVDIGMRMLTVEELVRAQGLPEGYILDAIVDGRPITKGDKIRMIGNSVSPYPAEALVRANFAEEVAYLEAA